MFNTLLVDALSIPRLLLLPDCVDQQETKAECKSKEGTFAESSHPTTQLRPPLASDTGSEP